MLRHLSLGNKITLSYSLLILSVSAILTLSLYGQLQSVQREAIQGRLQDIVTFAKHTLDPDHHALLLSQDDMTTASYNIVLNSLQTTLASSPIIKRVYSIRQLDNEAWVMVVDSNPDLTQRAAIGQPHKQSMSGNLADFTEAKIDPTLQQDALGQTFLRGYAPITDNFGHVNGLLVVEIDATSIVASERRALTTALTLFIVMVLSTLLLGGYITRFLMLPVSELTKATQHLAQGNFEVKVLVRSQDELGLLAEAFNQMAGQIESLVQTQQEQITQLRELDQLKSQFLTTMSHELRTPLNSILGFSDIILQGIDGELNEMTQQDVQNIYNSGQYLLAIVNDVLDLSKMEAGLMEIVPEAVDVAEIVAEVMAAVSTLVQHKPIELQCYLAPQLPLVYVDRIRIKQILFNLLDNAIKFTHAGEVTIQASLTHEAESGDEHQAQTPNFMEFAIKDTGLGIPADKQTVIFEAFQQVDMSRTRSHGGTGLGLTICQRLVAMHGGRIWIESELGQGTTVHFTVKLDKTS